MKKSSLILFISIAIGCTNSKPPAVAPTQASTYKTRFNNLLKLPSVREYVNGHHTGTIALLQSEGCTECNLEKLGFLKDSLIKASASPLVVISSTMDTSKDYAYKLFNDKFKAVIYHSDTMEKLGLSLRGFYLISFKDHAIDTWALYNKIIK